MPRPQVCLVFTVLTHLSTVPPISAKGILVKFLANPPEDSVAQYVVYRSTEPGQSGASVGQILPLPGADTLRFPDLTAEKGQGYFYSIMAVDRQGLESELSIATHIATPFLDLPDTLAPEAAHGAIRIALDERLHPLRGETDLRFEFLQASRFVVRADQHEGALYLENADAGPWLEKAVVMASYFGKFADIDTVILMNTPQAAVAVARKAPAHAPARKRRRLYDLLGRLFTGRRMPPKARIPYGSEQGGEGPMAGPTPVYAR